MKKLLVACAFLTLVGACSSTESEYNDPWIGISEEEVITRMGLPSRSYVSNEKKYLVYGTQNGGCRSGCGISQGFTPTYITSNAGYTFPVGSSFKMGGCGGCGSCGGMTTTVNACTFVLSGGAVEGYTGCGF